MTIRDRGFWLYMLFLALLSFVIVWFILVVDYHLGFELRNDFIVMDIGESSFSLQWPNGDIAFWISSGRFDWRLWPP
jgi:hypothetical protein